MPKMTTQSHLLIFDPIAFSGGSKKATVNILNLLSEHTEITVATTHVADWQGLKHKQVTIKKLYEPPILASAEMGVLYFLRHIFLFMQLMLIAFKSNSLNAVLGTSGPGVDLALYGLSYCHNLPLTQLIQGPVATSKTIGKCLYSADLVFYLPSCLRSLQLCMNNYASISDEAYLPIKNAAHFKEMHNGISAEEWPKPKTTYNQYPRLFWGASLLKWKGLDTFTEALMVFEDHERPSTSICYIQPNSTQLALSKSNQPINNVNWYSQHPHFSDFRHEHDIYISTSHCEPFGLAILEAMAAGLCVVIPNDGAYWDQVLTDKISCIKYQANNATDLHDTLRKLVTSPKTVKKIGENARNIAENYHANKTYQPIVDSLNTLLLSPQLKGLHYDKS